MTSGVAQAMIPLFLREAEEAGKTGFPPFVSWNQRSAQGLAAEIRHLQDELEKAHKLAGDIERSWEKDGAEKDEQIRSLTARAERYDADRRALGGVVGTISGGPSR